MQQCSSCCLLRDFGGGSASIILFFSGKRVGSPLSSPALTESCPYDKLHRAAAEVERTVHRPPSSWLQALWTVDIARK